MKARRTLRSLGEGGSGRSFREFRKIPRSLLRGASLIGITFDTTSIEKHSVGLALTRYSNYVYPLPLTPNLHIVTARTHQVLRNSWYDTCVLAGYHLQRIAICAAIDSSSRSVSAEGSNSCGPICVLRADREKPSMVLIILEATRVLLKACG